MTTGPHLNRIIADTVHNFVVDTDEGLYMEYANLHSITFPIHREVDNGKLENLVLSYQRNGTYKGKILVYDLSESEKQNLEIDRLQNIENPIVTIPLDDFDPGYVTEGCIDKVEVTEVIFIACHGEGAGGHSYADGNGNQCNFWNNNAGTPPKVLIKTTIKCLDAADQGGGGDNSNGNFDPSSPGSGGEPSYTADYPTVQTPPEEY